MKHHSAVALTLALAIVLTSCTSSPALDVSTAPAAVTGTTTPPPAREPTAEAERGARASPLGIGDTRKLSADSMWTVGATGATQVNDGFVILPLSVGFDWNTARANGAAEGVNPDDVGIDPWQALLVEYVTAGGRSYSSMDDDTVNIGDLLSNVGAVFPPTDTIRANVAVSVPNEEMSGGMWVVRNSSGATVFLASQ